MFSHAIPLTYLTLYDNIPMDIQFALSALNIPTEGAAGMRKKKRSQRAQPLAPLLFVDVCCSIC